MQAAATSHKHHSRNIYRRRGNRTIQEIVIVQVPSSGDKYNSPHKKIDLEGAKGLSITHLHIDRQRGER